MISLKTVPVRPVTTQKGMNSVFVIVKLEQLLDPREMQGLNWVSWTVKESYGIKWGNVWNIEQVWFCCSDKCLSHVYSVMVVSFFIFIIIINEITAGAISQFITSLPGCVCFSTSLSEPCCCFLLLSAIQWWRDFDLFTQKCSAEAFLLKKQWS